VPLVFFVLVTWNYVLAKFIIEADMENRPFQQLACVPMLREHYKMFVFKIAGYKYKLPAYLLSTDNNVSFYLSVSFTNNHQL
jgi:hypothetical protein